MDQIFNFICRTRLRRYNNPQRSSLCSAELDSMEPCHGSGPLCPPGSGEVNELEGEEQEPEEEREQLPPSVRLGVGYTKPHYQVKYIGFPCYMRLLWNRNSFANNQFELKRFKPLKKQGNTVGSLKRGSI